MSGEPGSNVSQNSLGFCPKQVDMQDKLSRINKLSEQRCLKSSTKSKDSLIECNTTIVEGKRDFLDKNIYLMPQFFPGQVDDKS